MAGCIAHAEVKYRNAVLMIASGDANYDTLQLNGQSVGGGLYLCPPTASDVDGWHSRAVEAGAHPVFRQRKTGWCARRARVLDPEGTSGASERIDRGVPGSSCCEFRTCLFGT